MAEKNENRKLRALRLSNEESNRVVRESIETALVQLLGQKDITEISIEEIVNRAGVSRMAYYRNYSSKDAILDNIFERVCGKIRTAMHPSLLLGDWAGARRALFGVLYEYKELCGTLVNAGESLRMMDFFNRLSVSYAENDSARERYRMIFWAGAAFDLTYQWVKEGMTVPPDELADYCNAAVFPRE